MIQPTAVLDRPSSEILIAAAREAGHAPSILNTQPMALARPTRPVGTARRVREPLIGMIVCRLAR